MDVIDAIASRRSIRKFGAESVNEEMVRSVLDAAVRAPTHHLTEPWRFVVLKGKALDDLGEVMADRIRRDYADSPDLEHKVELERSRPHRAPAIIAVVYTPSSNPKAIEVEDRYAIGAAIQNILLAAHGIGLGAYLRTGPAAGDEGVKRFLGLQPREEIAGFVYFGRPEPDQSEAMSRRTPAGERTTWMGWS